MRITNSEHVDLITVEWWDPTVGAWFDMGEQRSHAEANRVIREALEQNPEIRIRLVETSTKYYEHGA